MSNESKLSRRGLFKGVGLAAGAAALLEGAGGDRPGQLRRFGPGPVELPLEVNGEPRLVKVEPRDTLVHVLRDGLGLTGTKIGCDRGACGACTVLVDGTPTASCMTFALDLAGRKITTIEGLANGPQLAPVQAAFVAHDALQCGFCTPGQVMSLVALLRENARPTEEDVRRAVTGNLCRCGAYSNIVAAGLAASRREAS
jgi:aerobic-type carbon monoxide dehydrogenase small subunit (CoxS/CutS family)